MSLTTLLLAQTLATTQIANPIPRPLHTIHNIQTLTEIQEFYKNQIVVYPKLNSTNYQTAYETLYTSPNTTLQRGFGVCDDLSLLTIAMLLQVPYITEINLIQVGAEVQGKPAYHAYVIFKDNNNMWGYANNTTVSDTTYLTKGQALLQPIKLSDMNIAVPYFKINERQITYPGAWLFNDNLASKLNPTLNPTENNPTIE